MKTTLFLFGKLRSLCEAAGRRTRESKSGRLWIALSMITLGMMTGCETRKAGEGISVSGAVAPRAATDPADDPRQWLEEVEGTNALAWVRSQNERSTLELTNAPGFETLRQRLLAVYDSREKIPYVAKIGPYLYNYWQDAAHVRGLFRRTTMEEYRKDQPGWETVLDLDALAASEKENWVWKGYDVLYPDRDRCLVSLSRGGGDAVVVREFDLNAKAFVAGGFELPEAKSASSWRDRDTLYVGTDFGPGSLTSSGYPRLVKEWKRGTPLAQARQIFEGKATDVSVGAGARHTRGRRYDVIERGITFYSNESFLRRGDDWVRFDKPDDATIGIIGETLLLTLRSDWTVGGRTYAVGSLLAAPLEGYLRGERNLAVLFQPTDRKSLEAVGSTKNYILVSELENVRTHVYRLQPRADGGWDRAQLETPPFGRVAVSAFDEDESDDYWLTLSDFLTPTTLAIGTLPGGAPAKLKSLPAFFSAQGLKIEQHEAVSKDGTRVPYFLVGKDKLVANGSQPTLLYGYGGFEISMLPSYSARTGIGWLERGGVYALANIRGGGEFGPKWHQAALKANRQRAYDDFIAVAEDLISRRITSPSRLGIMGGSNGGLLMGNMFVQRPDLFGAVVCQVPLLDMRRFNKLLAGASWMGEYGDPDKPEEWAFLQNYSPYHHIYPDRKYPRAFFTTSTRDDRVHPGHARKMVNKLLSQKHDVLYYENIEGGHGGAANNKQAAFMDALAYTYLQQQLRLPPVKASSAR